MTFFALPAVATESPWSVEVTGLSVHASGPLDADDSTGLGLGVEYRISPRLGVQLSAATADVENSIEFEVFGDVVLFGESSFRLTPVTARLDVHLTPEGRIDLYAGPVVGWLRFGELESTIQGLPGGGGFRSKIELEDQLAWGGHLGIAADLGRRMYLTGGATFLLSEIEAAGDVPAAEAGDFDFWMFELGLGVRF